jgi:ferredoxin
MSWQVTVDRSACIGSGICAGVAPGRFRLDAESTSVPVVDEIEPDELVSDAAASCPMLAISILDLSTNLYIEP